MARRRAEEEGVMSDKEQWIVNICRFVLVADSLTFASAYCFGASFRISLGLALAATLLVWPFVILIAWVARETDK
jgi:ABC-type sulfate transport system permease component